MPETGPASSAAFKKTAAKKITVQKGGGWFHKIPRDVLFSPGGMILLCFALLMEIIDFLIPVPIVEETVMLPLNIIFCLGLIVIAKVPPKSLIIPFVIERIPVLSTLIPTFLLKMFF